MIKSASLRISRKLSKNRVGIIFGCAGALGMILALIFYSPADSGMLITVTTLDDEWSSDGDCSLREAIYAANEDSAFDLCPAGNGADIIYIPAGTYSITIPGLDNENFEGDLDILSDLTLQGAGVGLTIINGGISGLGQNLIHVPDDSYSLSVLVKDLTIAENSASGYAAGIQLQDSDSTVQLEDCSFENNQAIGANAGAIRNFGTLTIHRCTFDANTSAFNGGAIYSDGPLSVYDSTFTNNTAMSYFGGAIGMNGGILHVQNSTFTGNAAGTHGGAIYYSSSSGSLSNVTISGNTADFDDSGPTDVGDGGGIYFKSGTVAVRNTIIAENIDASTAGIPVVYPDCSIESAAVTSDGFNLIGDDSGCGSGIFTNGVNGDQVGTSSSSIDPLLGPLTNNGGPTWTMALLSGSPAIDAGDPSGCKDNDGIILGADQRGYMRPADGGYGGGCDAGAYEFYLNGSPNAAPHPMIYIMRVPPSVVRGSTPSGPNQWFLRVVLDDSAAATADIFHFIVWLYVPDDWQLPWATQYSFTGDFNTTTLSADAPAYSWIQTSACDLGDTPEPGYKWRAFRGPAEVMPDGGDRLTNQVNLRGGLRVPVSEATGVYGLRMVLGTYFDQDANGTPDTYQCNHIAVSSIQITD